MSESLSLFMVTLQTLIYNHLFNEQLYLSVKNNIQVEIKKKVKLEDFNLAPYRKVEKQLQIVEQSENKKTAETLVYKSQSIPSKRPSEGTNLPKFKRAKRETVRIMNEDFPIYKTMQFIDECSVTPVFTKEESMPVGGKLLTPPKESKVYIEVELRVNKIAKVHKWPKLESIQKFILLKMHSN